MSKKAVLLSLSDLAEELNMDYSVFNRGEYVNNLVDNPQNPLPYFFVRGTKLFRAADVDSWAAREIERQREQSERE